MSTREWSDAIIIYFIKTTNGNKEIVLCYKVKKKGGKFVTWNEQNIIVLTIYSLHGDI